jgi:CBS domain-containing protein
MAKCGEVMTREPACCEPQDSIVRAAQLMKTEDVGAIPVVDSQASRRLVGIITDRDIVVKVLAEGRAAEGASVRDAMTQNPVTVREDEDVNRAVSAMADRKVRRIPVVDANGSLLGIIAQADVATRLHRDKTTGDLVEAISEPQTVRR